MTTWNNQFKENCNELNKKPQISQCESHLNPHILPTLQNLLKYFKVSLIPLIHTKKLQKMFKTIKESSITQALHMVNNLQYNWK